MGEPCSPWEWGSGPAVRLPAGILAPTPSLSAHVGSSSPPAMRRSGTWPKDPPHQPKLRALEGWRGCSSQPGTEPFLGTPPVPPCYHSQRSYAPDLPAFVTVLAAAPEKINTTEEPGMEDSSPPSHIKAVILGVLLLGCVVVLVVLGYCIVTYRRGGGEPGDPARRAEGPGGVLGGPGGDAPSANPAGTWGQMNTWGARGLVCRAQTHAWLVPVGQASPC